MIHSHVSFNFSSFSLNEDMHLLSWKDKIFYVPANNWMHISTKLEATKYLVCRWCLYKSYDSKYVCNNNKLSTYQLRICGHACLWELWPWLRRQTLPVSMLWSSSWFLMTQYLECTRLTISNIFYTLFHISPIFNPNFDLLCFSFLAIILYDSLYASAICIIITLFWIMN